MFKLNDTSTNIFIKQIVFRLVHTCRIKKKKTDLTSLVPLYQWIHTVTSVQIVQLA